MAARLRNIDSLAAGAPESNRQRRVDDEVVTYPTDAEAGLPRHKRPWLRGRRKPIKGSLRLTPAAAGTSRGAWAPAPRAISATITGGLFPFRRAAAAPALRSARSPKGIWMPWTLSRNAQRSLPRDVAQDHSKTNPRCDAARRAWVSRQLAMSRDQQRDGAWDPMCLRSPRGSTWYQ